MPPDPLEFLVPSALIISTVVSILHIFPVMLHQGKKKEKTGAAPENKSETRRDFLRDVKRCLLRLILNFLETYMEIFTYFLPVSSVHSFY